MSDLLGRLRAGWTKRRSRHLDIGARAPAMWTFLVIGVVVACSQSPAAPSATPAPLATRAPSAGTSDWAAPTPTLFDRAPTADPVPSGTTNDRPFDVFVPPSYDGSRPMPLVILLHWLGATGAQVETEYKLEPLAVKQHFLYVHPNGTPNSWGDLSWNATDACCNASTPPVDNSAYLSSVIDAVKAEYNVDPKRVFAFGISNGEFMAHRLACDHADEMAAIVSIVGATFLDPKMCNPSEPVSVLEIHGTADHTVPYDGGQLEPGHPFPGSEQTVADWAALDGCAGVRTPTGEHLDLEQALSGSETVVSGFEGCPAGTAVELWTVVGGSHALQITPDFVPEALAFLATHPKP